jgi:hypothetical protein
MLFGMNVLVYILSVVPVFVAIIYAAVHILLKHEKKHHIQHVLTLGFSAIISYVVAVLLKNMIAHPRPNIDGALFRLGICIVSHPGMQPLCSHLHLQCMVSINVRGLFYWHLLL